MDESKIKLQDKKDNQTANFDKYRASKGINFNSSDTTINEVIDMSEYISRKEFEQYEKRIDAQFDTINSKIDNLPNLLADKITISLNQYEKDIKRDSKENRKAIITWILSGTGILIALAGLIGRVVGLY